MVASIEDLLGLTFGASVSLPSGEKKRDEDHDFDTTDSTRVDYDNDAKTKNEGDKPSPKIVISLGLKTGIEVFYAVFQKVRSDNFLEYVLRLSDKQFGKPCELVHFDSSIHLVKKDTVLVDPALHLVKADVQLFDGRIHMLKSDVKSPDPRAYAPIAQFNKIKGEASLVFSSLIFAMRAMSVHDAQVEKGKPSLIVKDGVIAFRPAHVGATFMTLGVAPKGEKEGFYY